MISLSCTASGPIQEDHENLYQRPGTRYVTHQIARARVSSGEIQNLAQDRLASPIYAGTAGSRRLRAVGEDNQRWPSEEY